MLLLHARSLLISLLLFLRQHQRRQINEYSAKSRHRQPKPKKIHRVRKKGTNSILGITSSNTRRFSKFFQCHNLLEICNKIIIKFPTTPQTRRYTTL